MHKTGACLPKQWQTGPLVQARVLDLGLPPEQLLAPARGCTLRQQDYSLSKCNEHVCHDYATSLMESTSSYQSKELLRR